MSELEDWDPGSWVHSGGVGAETVSSSALESAAVDAEAAVFCFDRFGSSSAEADAIRRCPVEVAMNRRGAISSESAMLPCSLKTDVTEESAVESVQ